MTDQAKLREDTKALSKLEYQEEVRDMLRRLDVPEEEILTIEKDENIPILMKAKELVKQLGTTEVFEKEENGRYKVYAKITAISLMAASVGMMADLGLGIGATPHFRGVARWLGISKNTLRRWWANQNLIMREKISLGSAAAQRMQLKMLEIAEFYTDGLLNITETQRDKLAETPQGVIAMQKIAQGALFQAKFLADQSGTITEEDQIKSVQEGTGLKHGVTILMPIETKKPVKKYKKEQGKDGNDITDRG